MQRRCGKSLLDILCHLLFSPFQPDSEDVLAKPALEISFSPIPCLIYLYRV